MGVIFRVTTRLPFRTYWKEKGIAAVREGINGMAIKTDDYIKYLTEKVVAYMDTPRDVRKEKKVLLKSTREPWPVRWFGMVPLSVHIWWEKRKRKKEHPDP